jgi:hypothetical protein
VSDKSIVQKLFIKPGHTVVILNAPNGYIETIGEIPENVKIQTKLVPSADIIQLFTKFQAELKDNFPTLKQTLKDNGYLWITYPKGTSKVDTDINRELIWHIGEEFGFKPAAMISIDPIWAAFKLKKVD